MSVFKQLQIEFVQMNNKSSENPPVMQAYNKTSMHAASILHRYLYTDTVISFYVITTTSSHMLTSIIAQISQLSQRTYHTATKGHLDIYLLIIGPQESKGTAPSTYYT